MTCQNCELLLGQDEKQSEKNAEVEEHVLQCVVCRSLSEDLRANALALESLRSDELPKLAVETPRRRRVYPGRVYSWMAAAAAAAAFVLAFLTPRPPPQVRPPVSRVVNEAAPPPLKIKMLTSDPNVVIYWLIEN